MPALAADGLSSPLSPEIPSFSAACLAPEGRLTGASTPSVAKAETNFVIQRTG